MSYKENEEHKTDRIFIGTERFERTGDVLYCTGRKIYNQLDEKIPSNVSVLDIGCGCGFGTVILGRDVIGIDKNQRSICFARTLYPWMQWEVWDISDTPWDSYPFPPHTVVCVDVIEHIKDYKKAMENIIQTAEKEIWISTPNRKDPTLPNEKPSLLTHVREFTIEEVLELIEKATKPVDVEILDYESFEPISINTEKSPIVYHLTRK